MKLEYVYPRTYNPDDVDVRLQNIPVTLLMEMIQSGNLVIAGGEELQRMSNLWNRRQKSLFIESILINLPIPLVYLDGSKKPWTIIDGLQRISTIYQFIHNEYKLENLEYLTDECNGKNFDSIPKYLQHRIQSFSLVAYVINPGTPNAVKYNIFKRINETGRSLNGQEIRNAFFHECGSKIINELAESPEFVQATRKSLSNKRMVDREFVNRYFAFRLLKEFYNGEMENFLDKGMNALESLIPDILDIEKNIFKETMTLCHLLLEENAFKKPDASSRINKSLFDSFTYSISRLNKCEQACLIKYKEPFLKQYFQLFNDCRFIQSITVNTSTIQSVDYRFNAIKKTINRFIKI